MDLETLLAMSSPNTYAGLKPKDDASTGEHRSEGLIADTCRNPAALPGPSPAANGAGGGVGAEATASSAATASSKEPGKSAADSAALAAGATNAANSVAMNQANVQVAGDNSPQKK